ncbi:MAG: hypothetical protein ACYCUG_15685 [Acidimicrobiales bacterium]
MFPTHSRTTGHGIAAGLGKLGAFIGVFLVPLLQAAIGLRGMLLVAAATAGAGWICTRLLPEPGGRSLDDIAAEPTDPARPSTTPSPPPAPDAGRRRGRGGAAVRPTGDCWEVVRVYDAQLPNKRVERGWRGRLHRRRDHCGEPRTRTPRWGSGATEGRQVIARLVLLDLDAQDHHSSSCATIRLLVIDGHATLTFIEPVAAGVGTGSPC